MKKTLDYLWATKLGVDVDKLIVVAPTSNSAEEIFEIAEKLICTGEISIIVLDSLASLLSAAELEKDYDEKNIRRGCFRINKIQ